MSMAEIYTDEKHDACENEPSSEYLQYYRECVEEGLRDYRAGNLISDEVVRQQAAERRARILARIANK